MRRKVGECIGEVREGGSLGCDLPSSHLMPRWIVFDGAPAVKLLVETANQAATPRSAWQTFCFRLAPPSSPRSTSRNEHIGELAGKRGTSSDGAHERVGQVDEPAQLWDVTTSQFADADLSRQRDEADAVPSSETDEDTLARLRKRPRRRSTPSPEPSEEIKVEAHDEYEGESRMSA